MIFRMFIIDYLLLSRFPPYHPIERDAEGHSAEGHEFAGRLAEPLSVTGDDALGDVVDGGTPTVLRGAATERHLL